MKRYPIFGVLISVAMISSLASMLPVHAAPAASSPPAAVSTLPVYRLTTPAVDSATVQVLARSFQKIGGTMTYSDTTHADTLRFTDINSGTGRMIEQYAASGGFFAYNHHRAFSETAALGLDAFTPAWLCGYLASKTVFENIAPNALNCSSPQLLPYEAVPIYLSTLSTGKMGNDPASTQAISTQTQIGLVYHVPLAINISAFNARFIPLGGPGGHLSILLTGNGDQESLDIQYQGINAIASPWHGRTKMRQGDYPIIPATEAIAQYKGLAPGVTITPGQPILEYYVGDPAVPQQFMMPMWHFPDATGEANGQVVDLRGIWLPAVSGFLPGVHITNPPSGKTYFPGVPLTVTGVISGSFGPFTYTLSLDDGKVLNSGVAPSGTRPMAIGPLPLFTDKGVPTSLHLQLVVTDTNGSSAQDSITLPAPRLMYLPLVMRNAKVMQFAWVGAIRDLAIADPAGAGAPTASHKMGVEWLTNYNGTNPNLVGTQPDANGFYNGLASAGWGGAFYWANNDAWERDWRDCSLGGGDCTLGVDRAEFAYFSGHGSPARIYFGTHTDDYSFFGANARYQNLRWAGFSSCETLRAGPYVGTGNPPLTYWFNAFQGAYMLLGFHSTMGDVAFGGPLIDNMRVPLFLGFIPMPWNQTSIREAWVQTAFAMNAGKPAYLYAVGAFDPVDFRLPDPSRGFDYTAVPLPPASITQYRWVWWN
jgi:Family of unknown function (DUF6345)